MTIFIALLRAVNVGGQRKLPMKDLASVCVELGYQSVRTYIQSGNVILETVKSEKSVRAALEQALTTRMVAKVDVMVRSASEMRLILEANPFPDAPSARVGVAFLSDPVSKMLLGQIVSPTGEEVRLGTRELYIHYPQGMGKSKLKLPSAVGPATVRNINTVAKLVAMTTT